MSRTGIAGRCSRSTQGTPECQADTSLFIPPVVAKTMDGDPEEEVELARDEVANMVCGQWNETYHR